MAARSKWPLLRRPADAVFARRKGSDLSFSRFIQDAVSVSGRLPESAWYCNLCIDPYWFAVTFVAVAAKGGKNLLPANQGAGTLSSLSRNYPAAPWLTDRPLEYAKSSASDVRLLADDVGHHPLPDIPSEQRVARVFTSGSTGPSVAIDKTWGELTAAARVNNELLQDFIASGDSVVSTVPPHHMYGLEWSVLSLLGRESSMYCGPCFYPAEVSAALANVPSPRRLISTPVHLSALLRSGLTLPSVDLIMSATAPLDLMLAERIARSFNGRLLEIYGCSETGSLAWREPCQSEQWKFLPCFDVTQNSGKTMVSARHLRAAVSVSDRLEFDDGGGFRIVGRRHDVIKMAGKRESLQRLNDILLGIEGVVDGTFFVPPDEAPGQRDRLVAFVVCHGISGAAVRQSLVESLDAVFVPRPLLLVDHLPRERTGKLSREALLELLERRGSESAN